MSRYVCWYRKFWTIRNFNVEIWNKNPGAVKETTNRMSLLYRFLWWHRNSFIALSHWLSVNHYVWYVSNFCYWLPWAMWSGYWFNLTPKAFSNFQDFFVFVNMWLMWEQNIKRYLTNRTRFSLKLLQSNELFRYYESFTNLNVNDFCLQKNIFVRCTVCRRGCKFDFTLGPAPKLHRR